MNNKNLFHPLALALLLATGFGSPAALALPAAAETEAAAPAAPAARQLYWNGHDALGRSDWNEAVDAFRELETELRSSGAEGVDGALYWQAYALNSARRNKEAAQLAIRLTREFPDSRWRGEARKFLADADLEAGSDPAREREADALMALDALMVNGSNKVVPTLERVLASDHSDKVKTRALFVLSQVDAEAANRALDRILTSNSSERMKREAVQQIAIGGNSASLEKLVALYPRSEPRLRRAILNAYMIAGRSDLLGQVARSETDPKMQRQAIQLLGAHGDRAAIKALYRELTDPKAKRHAIQALGIAGDSEAIGEILNSATEADVQQAALEALGIAGGKGAREPIMQAYRQAVNESVRQSAVQALLIAGDGEALLRLYRETQDKAQKRELLQALSVTDSDKALELIDEQL